MESKVASSMRFKSKFNNSLSVLKKIYFFSLCLVLCSQAVFAESEEGKESTLNTVKIQGLTFSCEDCQFDGFRSCYLESREISCLELAVRLIRKEIEQGYKGTTPSIREVKNILLSQSRPKKEFAALLLELLDANETGKQFLILELDRLYYFYPKSFEYWFSKSLELPEIGGHLWARNREERLNLSPGVRWEIVRLEPRFGLDGFFNSFLTQSPDSTVGKFKELVAKNEKTEMLKPALSWLEGCFPKLIKRESLFNKDFSICPDYRISGYPLPVQRFVTQLAFNQIREAYEKTDIREGLAEENAAPNSVDSELGIEAYLGRVSEFYPARISIPSYDRIVAQSIRDALNREESEELKRLVSQETLLFLEERAVYSPEVSQLIAILIAKVSKQYASEKNFNRAFELLFRSYELTSIQISERREIVAFLFTQKEVVEEPALAKLAVELQEKERDFAKIFEERKKQLEEEAKLRADAFAEKEQEKKELIESLKIREKAVEELEKANQELGLESSTASPENQNSNKKNLAHYGDREALSEGGGIGEMTRRVAIGLFASMHSIVDLSVQQKLGLIFIVLFVFYLIARYTGKRAERLKRLTPKEWEELRDLLKLFNLKENSKIADLKISFNQKLDVIQNSEEGEVRERSVKVLQAQFNRVEELLLKLWFDGPSGGKRKARR